MLLFASVLKLVAEVALMALAGQWLLGLLAGAGRERNPFYRLLDTIGRPFVRLSAGALKLLGPNADASGADRRARRVTLAWLALVWLLALALKVRACLALGMELCR